MISDAHLRRAGITPGRRGFSNSPETFQSDLVDAEVDRIMGDRDELSDLLGKLLEVQPEIASLLALVTVRGSREISDLTDVFIYTTAKVRDIIDSLVQKYCEKEVGL